MFKRYCYTWGRGKGNTITLYPSKGYRLISSTKGLLFICSPVVEICKVQTVIFDKCSVKHLLGVGGVVHNSRLLGWV